MNIVLVIVSGLIGLIAGALALRRYLRGESLTRYDPPAVPGRPERTLIDPSPEHIEVVEWLGSAFREHQHRRGRDRIDTFRRVIDSLGEDVDMNGLRIVPVDAGGVAAEWVLADGADPDRRLLYLHGGAWIMGSPKSHRRITAKLSRIAGAAVLAIDYRLMPEHARLDCLVDCQSAYRWLLDHGPQGAAPVQQLFIAGDSAGGNLTLAILAWARDAGVRAADAAVTLAPSTDGTMTSPSLEENLNSDPMLGPMFGHLANVPRDLILLAFWLRARIRPCDPRVSPIHGNLHGLPPTLIHASEAEMLLDDARRYARKAHEAGSPVTLETWPHMLHVWHLFDPKLPEARDAFIRIGHFLDICAPRRAA